MRPLANQFRLSCLALAAGLLWLAAAAAEITAEAEVVPAQCRVGDLVAFRVSATVPRDVAQEVEPRPPAFAGFEVVDGPLTTRLPKVDAVAYTWTFQLRPNRSGTLIIPPFTLRYLDLRDNHYHFRTTAKVRLTVADPATLNDLRPRRDVVPGPDFTAPWRAAAILVAIAFALALVSGLIAWQLARRAQAAAARAAADAAPTPPHEVALRRLDELAAQRLPELGERERFHVGLSVILRDYLGERYGFHARESTTTEIVGRLEDKRLTEPLLRHCRKVLTGCDQEKFAGHQATMSEMHDLLREARSLVKQTAAGWQPPGEGGRP